MCEFLVIQHSCNNQATLSKYELCLAKDTRLSLPGFVRPLSLAAARTPSFLSSFDQLADARNHLVSPPVIITETPLFSSLSYFILFQMILLFL